MISSRQTQVARFAIFAAALGLTGAAGAAPARPEATPATAGQTIASRQGEDAREVGAQGDLAGIDAQKDTEKDTEKGTKKDTKKGTKKDTRDKGTKGENKRKIEELERKLDVVVAELEELRSGSRSGENPARPAARTGLAPSAAKVYTSPKRLSIGGYGEWLVQSFADTRDDGMQSGKRDESDFLRLILYAGYKFDDRLLLNTELEWEHASTGSSGEASVEFAYLDYRVSDAFNIRAGLLLVPVGLVNEMHEPPTFTSARRPDVESVILPSTWRETGAGAWGSLGDWDYRLYLVNGLDSSGFSSGKGIRGGRQKGSKALAEDWALTGRLDYRGVPGLTAGVSFFSGRSGQGAEASGRKIGGKVTTLDAHARYDWRALELRGLWSRVSIDDAELISLQVGEPVGSRLTGWYLQAGWDLLAARSGKWELIPFVKYEAYDTLAEQPLLPAKSSGGAYDRSSWTYGLALKPHPNVALKLDYQDYDAGDDSAVDQLNVALGFSF